MKYNFTLLLGVLLGGGGGILFIGVVGVVGLLLFLSFSFSSFFGAWVLNYIKINQIIQKHLF